MEFLDGYIIGYILYLGFASEFFAILALNQIERSVSIKYSILIYYKTKSCLFQHW
jgi:hypothetical protein